MIFTRKRLADVHWATNLLCRGVIVSFTMETLYRLGDDRAEATQSESWFGGMVLYADLLVLILNPLWALGESPGVTAVSVWQAEQPIAETPITVGGSC